MKKLIFILPICLLLYMFSCSSDSTSGGGDNDNFDRVSLTTSWVNNLMLRAANDFEAKVTTLNESVIAFTNSPNEIELALVRTNLFEAYKVWQHVEMFFFGSGFALDINSYPADIPRIEENIDSDTEVNLSRTLLNNSQGLPAIDYLINGVAQTDTEIVDIYQQDKFKAYLKRLADRMVTLTTTAIDEFEAVKSSRLNSVDNTISSYFSIQVNDFVQYIEKSFREAKIATPSGTRNRPEFPNITAQPSPDFVESLYSPENSKTLYLEAYDAIQDFYYGRSYNGNSNTVGLQEYLQALGTTIMIDGNDILLDDYIEQLFDNINAANANITDNFYEQTQDFNPNFDAVFDAVQEFVIAIKSNAINAFNLTIDFVDSDGD